MDYLIEKTYKNNLETLNLLYQQVEFAKELYKWLNEQFTIIKKQENETQESVQQ